MYTNGLSVAEFNRRRQQDLFAAGVIETFLKQERLKLEKEINKEFVKFQ